VSQRVDRRLGQDLIRRVVSEHAVGISTTRLTRRYGIGKGTLLRLLHEHGVTVRHQHTGARRREGPHIAPHRATSL
jgi:hypothetical protein